MKKINVFAGIRIALVSIIVSYLGFLGLEPMVARAVEYDTDAVTVGLTVTDEISISSYVSSIALSGTVLGVSGGTATTTGDELKWTVVTSGVGGYTLSIAKDHLLLTGAGGTNSQFSDYTEVASGTADYSWKAGGSVGSGNEEFGFAPYSGTDWKTAFKNDTIDCVGGTVITAGFCWIDIPTTSSSIEIASNSASTTGATTAVMLKAQAGGSNSLVGGAYSTIITATARTN